MREILFRAKRVDNGEWVEGYYWYSKKKNKHFICGESKDYSYKCVEVILETVSQYTGLTDKNGKKIFEGDIVSHFSNNKAHRINGKVYFDTLVCAYCVNFNTVRPFLADLTDVIVVGNIFDSPELLEEKIGIEMACCSDCLCSRCVYNAALSVNECEYCEKSFNCNSDKCPICYNCDECDGRRKYKWECQQCVINNRNVIRR